jgi:CIC family chloride channel protein
VLAALVSLLAIGFLRTLRLVRGWCSRSRLPRWALPAVGVAGAGRVLDAGVGDRRRLTDMPGQGLGILGGGYGAVQLAISGSPWLPMGWCVVLLLLRCPLPSCWPRRSPSARAAAPAIFAPRWPWAGCWAARSGTPPS